MSTRTRITSIEFKNYKAFAHYSVSLSEFNVLVGPNNAGKSTVLGALRILAEGLRKARSRNPEFVSGPIDKIRGYGLNLRGLPVSTENVFHNYDDSSPATVKFRLSNGNELLLFFPEQGVCNLIPQASRPLRSTTNFRSQFDVNVAFVPILGPVDHNERLYKAEAARLALLSPNASRNFRNIWYHFPEGFRQFRDTISATWPGMDIQAPEIINRDDESFLYMFCPEDRYPRELFWAGFGFQVWCQMLTFIIQGKDSSLLVIDEPDIYLHSDLQRQLVNILRELGPDIVIATHSTEIISEVEADSILNVNKRFRSAKRIKDTHELQRVFSVLGSNLNPTLTQLAKTRRVVFVEGKDFQILARFARRLGLDAVANRAHFAVIPVEGFNPQKVKDFSSGMEITLGTKLLKIVVFDRDYRSSEEVKQLVSDLQKFCWHTVVLGKKEIENYLFEPEAISRAIKKKLTDRGKASAGLEPIEIKALLMQLSESLKNKVQSQLVIATQQFERRKHPDHHASTVSEKAMNEFDIQWTVFENRMSLVPGKDVLSLLNHHFQTTYHCALTVGAIVDAFPSSVVSQEISDLLKKINDSANNVIGDQDDSRENT
jgi:energy-coupling factor transporter ATP-binding protein EcfA2